VRTIAIPRKAKTSTARKAIEHQRGFRRHVKWRTGSGGRISYLKRSYGWNRTTSMASKEHRSGADTGYSPTIWSR
jgi:IS5 family transposase